MIFNYYWHRNWMGLNIGLSTERWALRVGLLIPFTGFCFFFVGKLWGRRWRILINSCLMKNTFTNWCSRGKKRGKLLPVGRHQEVGVAALGFLSAPMTSHPAAPGAKTPLEIHFVNFLQPTSGFCSFRLPAKWIQFFLIICMVCAGVCGWAHAHIEFVLSIKESWLLATIARPQPRPTVSQVADAFTHTSLPLLPPPPTAPATPPAQLPVTSELSLRSPHPPWIRHSESSSLRVSTPIPIPIPNPSRSPTWSASRSQLAWETLIDFLNRLYVLSKLRKSFTSKLCVRILCASSFLTSPSTRTPLTDRINSNRISRLEVLWESLFFTGPAFFIEMFIKQKTNFFLFQTNKIIGHQVL